jgi:hypothetical protein
MNPASARQALTGAREPAPRFQSKGPRSRPPRSAHERDNGPRYKPGDPVKETGVYEVVHDRGHRAPHEAVMLANDLFPPCDTCVEKVRFRLVRPAPYIFDDDDFED